jgi:hypothetical protein
MLLYWVFVIYFRNPMNDSMFPLNLFSTGRKLSSTRWYPLKSRPLDSFNCLPLCERCDRVTRKSKLIMGSSWFLTKLVEHHKFWPSLEELKSSALGQNNRMRCHLCCLFWYSIGTNPRDGTELSSENEFSSNLRSNTVNAKSSETALRVKIWEERPLCLYTYTQLYMGDKAIGARILIHSDKLFQECKLSLYFYNAIITENYSIKSLRKIRDEI